MSTTRFAVSISIVSALVLGASVAGGQSYPNKPIRIITGSVGGGGDFASRLIAQGISVPLGQPVTVENRGTVLAIDTVAKAPPDGYTLLVGGSPMWIGPLLQKASYDPVKDFAPITITDRAPSIVVVHPSVPVKSIKELIALAKARPRELNYGSGTTGSPPHLAGELFKAMAHVDMVRIPYKAFGVAINDLIAGEVQVVFPGPVLAVPHIKSGRLRALAVTSAQQSALFPGLPTVAASGLPGYEFVQITAVSAPAKTPEAIINRLNQEIVRVLNRDDVKEKFLSTGTEAVGSSAEQLGAAMKSEMATMGKLIKDAGITAD